MSLFYTLLWRFTQNLGRSQARLPERSVWLPWSCYRQIMFYNQKPARGCH